MKLLSNSIVSRANSYLKQLRDVRVLGLYVFVVIALIVTWSGVGVIQSNYQLQKQISRLEQEVELRKLENDTLKLRNEYYNTEQYLELAARKLGKGAQGETLLLVPEHVALANSIELPKEDQAKSTPKAEKPRYQKNFEAWMEFLFRRNINR
jgi:cell division protein FtsB